MHHLYPGIIVKSFRIIRITEQTEEIWSQFSNAPTNHLIMRISYL